MNVFCCRVQQTLGSAVLRDLPHQPMERTVYKKEQESSLSNKDSLEARWVGELEQEGCRPWEDLNSQPCRRPKENAGSLVGLPG